MRRSAGDSYTFSMGQPVAIVLIVLILGASAYMWTRGYLRSRAALVTIGAILIALGYLAFFTSPTAGIAT